MQAPAQAAPGIYICPKERLTPTALSERGVCAVINMTGFDLDPIPGVSVVNLSLNDDELLDTEIARARDKIANIASRLAANVQSGIATALVCDTGANKSAVVLGYYLRQTGMPPCETLRYIDTLGRAVTPADAPKPVCLLTNQSFRKILHERKKLSATCDCWTLSVYSYRPQANIDY
jgi:hypothetical protein